MNKKFAFGFYPTPLDKQYLKEICQKVSIVAQRGWLYGTAGNFSLRSGSGDRFYISPSGVDKSCLSWEQFIAIDQMGQPLNSSIQKVSAEVLIHMQIMALFRQAKVVVHAHTPFLVRQTNQTAKKSLVFVDQEILKAFGCSSPREKVVLPVAPNPAPLEMSDFIHTMAQYCQRQCQAIVFKSHGAYCWGKDVEEAFARLEILEYLCQSVVD